MSKKTNRTKYAVRVIANATSFAFALLLQLQLMAQQKTVTGKVVNAASGEAIAGASILVKGTSTGSTSDDKGLFSLNVPADAATLVISYTGFLEMEIPVSAGFREIRLTSLGDLGEVVVVGYGNQKKATLTGAVEQISSKTFESRAVTNIGLGAAGALRPGW